MAALRYYLTTAFEDTSTQRHLVSKVRPYLTHDLPTVRADALAICTELLEEHVDAADTAAITNRLDDPDETVREQALEACESLGVLTSPGWLDQTLATASNDQTRLLAKHLAEQATEAPTTIKSVTDELTTLLTEEDATVRQHATTAVAALAEASPESVRHMVPQLLTVLDDASEHARENACTALHRIGDEFPEPVIDAVPAVVPLLSDSTSDVQHEALRVLLAVGKDYPEEIKPAVPDIRTCLQNDTFPIAASATLGHLAKEYPQVAEPAIETYQQWLTDQNYRVRNNALEALADLADHYPDQVVEHNQTYIELLVDDDERVRYNATSVISKLAKTYSGAVRAATNTLSDLLDDDFDQTRQNVCWALGRLGATEAITDLKHIRTHDSAESVQAAATAALEMLERNECPHCGARVARCDMEIAIGYPEWVRWPCPECNQQVHRKIDHA